MLPADAEALVAMLAPQARDWIVAQQQRYRPHSSPVPREIVLALSAFYAPQTLQNARYLSVDILDNPPFYAELQHAEPGIPLIDFSAMDGITFDDTMILRSSVAGLPSLFFHELVHVVQYSRLRPAAFAARYVRGWSSNGMEYARIPLELDAYTLQRRFDSGHAPFSVEKAVVEMLSARRET